MFSARQPTSSEWNFSVYANVVAATASETGGFDPFSLLLPLALAFLIFTMFRRQRKAQTQAKELRTHMEPGTEVMTQFGLFGTIVSIDHEENKAVLELSPGNRATVHMQALSKVVTQEPAAPLEPTTVPDDASSLVADPEPAERDARAAESQDAAPRGAEDTDHPEDTTGSDKPGSTDDNK